MKSKMLLTLLAGLLLVLPGMAWGANSIVLESKTLQPNMNGSPAFTVRVSITNDDSLTFFTLVLAEQTTAGTAYALLNSPRSYTGIINNLTNTLKFSSIANATAAVYNDASPDSFLAAGGFDPTDPTTTEPPNASLKPVWEIKFKHTSDSLGQVTLRAVNGNISGQVNTFTNTVPVDIKPIAVTPGILTIQQFDSVTNCSSAGGNLLYGRPYSFTFTSLVTNGSWSIVSGPGSIDPNTGAYSFAGQCPLGVIPVVVRHTTLLGATADCAFQLNVIDNAPSCSPVSPTVTVSHGALATNHVNSSDPDAGDVVTVHQTSGPGATTAGGDWSYTTSCADVGRSPQTVQEQAVDGFANCTPGPLSATCEFKLVVTNAPPSITCPPSSQVQAGSAYSANATVSDPDPADAGSLTVTGTAVPPITGFAVTSAGVVSAAPTAADAGPHVITLTVTDGCGATAQCSYTLTVVVGAKFRICIDTVHAFQGTDVEVAIRNLVDATDPNDPTNGKSVGGFSLLLSYDCSCLEFLSARKGALLVQQRWEFFTFRFGAVGNGNCGAGCPSCLIRVVAIADVNNGANHPNLTRQNQGEWVVLKFRTSNDRRLAGQCCGISWFWFDCNDNTVSDSTGNRLWVVDSLLTTSGAPIDLATAFPNNVANCDQFSGGPGKPTPVKFIIFCNGAICLPTPQEIDDRGDLNLNGVKNDIADAVLYENYFIYGPGVLSSDPTRRQGQIAASDVNGDGTVLSVADLVMMIRIITGDAFPVPKSIPADWTVNMSMHSSASEVSVSANSGTELGGLYLKFRVDGTVGTPVLAGAAEGMTVKSNLVGGYMTVLIYSESKTKIAANAGEVLRIPADGNVSLVESEASSYFGAMLPTVSKVAALPTAFGLSQNYPNPFNGKTSFVLSLPVASDFKVTIYNVAGQVVRTYEGSAPAGNRTIVWDGADSHGTPVSSGVYFYKAAANNFSTTKKMLYLK